MCKYLIISRTLKVFLLLYSSNFSLDIIILDPSQTHINSLSIYLMLNVHLFFICFFTLRIKYIGAKQPHMHNKIANELIDYFSTTTDHNLLRYFACARAQHRAGKSSIYAGFVLFVVYFLWIMAMSRFCCRVYAGAHD